MQARLQVSAPFSTSGDHPIVLCLSPSFATTSAQPVEELESAGARLILARGRHAEGTVRTHLARASALIVGTEQVDAAMLAAAPNLVVVAKHGAGLDNIDVDAATAEGVAVTSAAGANAGAVAELAMGLLLGLARGIVFQDSRVRGGSWSVATGKALEGSTLGIVGVGRIGRLVARRAAAFGMKVLAFDVVIDDGTSRSEDPWDFADLDTLLRESDFITLHVPLTAETDGLIGERALRMMKPTAYLVNTSRGGIVDEAALARAISDHRLAGAALDVFATEPVPPSHPLILERERTILTPHMGAYTDRALTETSMVTARNVVAALKGTWPPQAVNRPAVWRGGAVPSVDRHS
jgi:D-3-phosphoglycerate dehydrogenase / 2-oxoglutarate reductase